MLGHVTASGTAVPVAEAAVFLEREPQTGESEPIRIVALTDEQGVFVVDDPPPGNYRLAVYKDDSSVEVAGLEARARRYDDAARSVGRRLVPIAGGPPAA